MSLDYTFLRWLRKESYAIKTMIMFIGFGTIIGITDFLLAPTFFLLYKNKILNGMEYQATMLIPILSMGLLIVWAFLRSLGKKCPKCQERIWV